MFASLHTSTLALGRVQRRGGQGLFSRLAGMIEVSRQRRQLAALDDALLRDIGLTREEALREASRPGYDDGRRPLWDAPSHWLQHGGIFR